jgi:hypothetical protein
LIQDLGPGPLTWSIGVLDKSAAAGLVRVDVRALNR